jgi:hypothetical protein
MSDISSINQDELVGRITAKLNSRPHTASYSEFDVAPVSTQSSAYVLILGAGFSHGVVPLVDELMYQSIGDYYYPDQDQWHQRPADISREDSARFWAEFNKTAMTEQLETVDLDDGTGLPKNPGAAYQHLFTYEGANVLFAQREPKRESYVERLQRLRKGSHDLGEQRHEKPRTGELFVKGFLRYVMDPGTEHGFGSTGRHELNAAHIYLAALLEAQQLGRRWNTCAFCRTLITTNFDTLLQNALQMVNLLYRLTDRPEKGLDRSDFDGEEGPIHLVYTHGSILRHNPASTGSELRELKEKNIDVLRGYLESRDVITIGYSGWPDGLMAALSLMASPQQNVYWCDILPSPAPHVAAFLGDRVGRSVYVRLGKTGADGFMRALYEALTPADIRRDPMQRYRDWRGSW